MGDPNFNLIKRNSEDKLSSLILSTDVNINCLLAGVSHGDDTGYILGVQYMNPTETEADRKMSKLLINMWVNFAKTGQVFIAIHNYWEYSLTLGTAFTVSVYEPFKSINKTVVNFRCIVQF